MNKTQTFQWHKRLCFTLGLAVLVPLALTNCAKKEEDTVTSTFSSIYTKVFSKACVECHVPGTAATVQRSVQIDFSSQASGYQTLLAGYAHGLLSVGTCSTVRLVAAGSPATSYLAAVLFSDYNTSGFAGTSCVPYNEHLQSINITAAEKNAILGWIQSGAPNN